MDQVGLQLHHIFERIAAHAPAEDADRRFEHFKARIWPRIRDSGSGGGTPTRPLTPPCQPAYTRGAE